MKIYIKNNTEYDQDDILYMSNARGKYIVNPHALPFSFYFSGKQSSHGPRVKPIFNDSRMITAKAGTLKLCDDWNYIPGVDDKNVPNKQISEMKRFFKDYIVLFCLVWELNLSDPVLADYFEGRASFKDLIKDIDFYDKYKTELDKINDVKELEEFCRRNNLVNFYGN